MKPEQAQNFKGTKAERKFYEDKLVQDQELNAQVSCENNLMKNVFRFKYLVSIFAADGDHRYDVRRRVGMAMTRIGKLSHVFNANIRFGNKLRIYKAAVCSLLTYGCEAWHLTRTTMATLNGANARCLSRFTGKSIHEEASTRSRTFDLVSAIRIRRLRWLGHILRMPDNRLVKLAVKVQFDKR